MNDPGVIFFIGLLAGVLLTLTYRMEIPEEESEPVRNKDGLLHCPFCGGETEIYLYNSGSWGGYKWRCKDYRCGVHSDSMFKTKELAIKHLNTRMIDRRLLQAVEEIELEMECSEWERASILDNVIAILIKYFPKIK